MYVKLLSVPFHDTTFPAVNPVSSAGPKQINNFSVRYLIIPLKAVKLRKLIIHRLVFGINCDFFFFFSSQIKISEYVKVS